MNPLENRITHDPLKCGGKACIRGLRIRVIDVIDLLAAGVPTSEILDDFPDLEADDIPACLRYASLRLDQAEAAR